MSFVRTRELRASERERCVRSVNTRLSLVVARVLVLSICVVAVFVNAADGKCNDEVFSLEDSSFCSVYFSK